MAIRKQRKALADPQAEIAKLKAELGNAYHRLDNAIYRKQEIEADLARAQVTIEALQHLLVKERAANDIPF